MQEVVSRTWCDTGYEARVFWLLLAALCPAAQGLLCFEMVPKPLMTQMTQFGLDFHKSCNFLMCILLSFSDIHVTAAFFFWCWFKMHARSPGFLLSVKFSEWGKKQSWGEGEKNLQNSGSYELGFCSAAVFTACWMCLLLGFVGHLQLRRNLLMRQAMMHFSVVQVKCFLKTPSEFVLGFGNPFLLCTSIWC